MSRECPTSASALNQPEGTDWMWLTPHQWQPSKAAVDSSHSHPKPRPRLASMKTAWQTGPWEVTLAVPFLNPDPIAHLVGWSNEASIIVDGQVTVLINLEAQVSSVSSGFCEQMTVKVHPLDRLLELDGTRGSAIPYLGYVEFNLQILGIRGYNEDVLLLVILTTTCSKKIPVMLGPKIMTQQWKWSWKN